MISRYIKRVAVLTIPLTVLSALLSKTVEIVTAVDTMAISKTAALAYVWFQIFWKDLAALLVLLLLMPLWIWLAKRCWKTWRPFVAAVRTGEHLSVSAAVIAAMFIPLLCFFAAKQALLYYRGKTIIYENVRGALATAAIRAAYLQDISKAHRILSACFALNPDSIACGAVKKELDYQTAILRRAQALVVAFPDDTRFKQCLLLQLTEVEGSAAEAKKEYISLTERYRVSVASFKQGAKLLASGDLTAAAASIKEVQRYSPYLGYSWRILEELERLRSSQKTSITAEHSPYAAFLIANEQGADQLLDADGIPEPVALPTLSQTVDEKHEGNSATDLCFDRYYNDDSLDDDDE